MGDLKTVHYRCLSTLNMLMSARDRGLECSVFQISLIWHFCIHYAVKIMWTIWTSVFLQILQMFCSLWLPHCVSADTCLHKCVCKVKELACLHKDFSLTVTHSHVLPLVKGICVPQMCPCKLLPTATLFGSGLQYKFSSGARPEGAVILAFSAGSQVGLNIRPHLFVVVVVKWQSENIWLYFGEVFPKLPLFAEVIIVFVFFFF